MIDSVKYPGYPNLVMHRLRWIPNALSTIRMTLGFFNIAIFICEVVALGAYYLSAAKIVFLFTGIGIGLDKLDGYLAKKNERHGWRTDTGKWLDPLADKVLAASVLVPFIICYLWQNGTNWYEMWFMALALWMFYYTRETTRLRQKGLIAGAIWTAQLKEGFLMGSELGFAGSIAFSDLAPSWGQQALLIASLIAMTLAALISKRALEEYYEIARKNRVL